MLYRGEMWPERGGVAGREDMLERSRRSEIKMHTARVIKEDLLRLVVALEDVSRKEVDHFC